MGYRQNGNNRGSETVREPLIDKYSKEELEEIVKGSKCMKDILRSIGYSTVSGRNSDTVKKRIQKYGISTDHFKSVHPTKRNEDNVFCNHSTATQATLRRWYKKISDDSKCEICGQGKMCIECRGEERRKNIPDREELKCLIMSRSFVKVGEIYNVSDNAVRKWCKSYGLPYTRKAISQL